MWTLIYLSLEVYDTLFVSNINRSPRFFLMDILVRELGSISFIIFLKYSSSDMLSFAPELLYLCRFFPYWGGM